MLAPLAVMLPQGEQQLHSRACLADQGRYSLVLLLPPLLLLLLLLLHPLLLLPPLH
jgi:hypothetical protein